MFDKMQESTKMMLGGFVFVVLLGLSYSLGVGSVECEICVECAEVLGE